jgi:hypothetical protein
VLHSNERHLTLTENIRLGQKVSLGIYSFACLSDAIETAVTFSNQPFFNSRFREEGHDIIEKLNKKGITVFILQQMVLQILPVMPSIGSNKQ